MSLKSALPITSRKTGATFSDRPSAPTRATVLERCLHIDKVLQNCPNLEWKLIVSLSRYGGLRCPSETLALRWSDILWEENKIRVPSPKTKSSGKSFRLIPLFPELKALLDEARPASNSHEHVITKYRDAKNSNLRTHLIRILKKGGITPWPRLFHNLRASRQTELANDFPLQVVSDWLGNSPTIARQHYLKTTEQHFERAITGVGAGAGLGQKMGLKISARSGKELQKNFRKSIRDWIFNRLRC